MAIILFRKNNIRGTILDHDSAASKAGRIHGVCGFVGDNRHLRKHCAKEHFSFGENIKAMMLMDDESAGSAALRTANNPWYVCLETHRHLWRMAPGSADANMIMQNQIWAGDNDDVCILCGLYAPSLSGRFSMYMDELESEIFECMNMAKKDGESSCPVCMEKVTSEDVTLHLYDHFK